VKAYEALQNRPQTCQESWLYERLVSYAEELEEAANELYRSSNLPHQPDIKAIDNLCMEIVEEAIK
jgi:hypothetical protein